MRNPTAALRVTIFFESIVHRLAIIEPNPALGNPVNVPDDNDEDRDEPDQGKHQQQTQYGPEHSPPEGAHLPAKMALKRRTFDFVELDVIEDDRREAAQSASDITGCHQAINDVSDFKVLFWPQCRGLGTIHLGHWRGERGRHIVADIVGHDFPLIVAGSGLRRGRGYIQSPYECIYQAGFRTSHWRKFTRAVGDFDGANFALFFELAYDSVVFAMWSHCPFRRRLRSCCR